MCLFNETLPCKGSFKIRVLKGLKIIPLGQTFFHGKQCILKLAVLHWFESTLMGQYSSSTEVIKASSMTT